MLVFTQKYTAILFVCSLVFNLLKRETRLIIHHFLFLLFCDIFTFNDLKTNFFLYVTIDLYIKFLDYLCKEYKIFKIILVKGKKLLSVSLILTVITQLTY